VSAWGALAGGVAGTLVLTTMLRAASELGLTRMDIPFLLGTAISGDRRKAKVVGYLAHFLAGLAFAFVYYAFFLVLGSSSWWLGAVLGGVHAAFAGTVLVNVLLPTVHPRMGSGLTAAPDIALLEAPGFMMLNYGVRTPLVTVLAHVAYGAIVVAFISSAG
jgi:hypothetical protein